MAERKGMGRSLGAVGGSGRGGDQGRSEGGREWGYGEEGVGRGRETEGLMSPPIMRMRGLSREGRGGPLPIGRGGMRGRGGGATGAGRAQGAGLQKGHIGAFENVAGMLGWERGQNRAANLIVHTGAQKHQHKHKYKCKYKNKYSPSRVRDSSTSGCRFPG
jgi:hypothetical protein